MSVSEADTGGRDNTATLADACEAVIGALFLDGGLDAARGFIRRHWDAYVTRTLRPPQDPKTALQEWAQARGLPLPRYEIVSRAGPDHEPTFEIRAVVSGLTPATAFGTSKRLAEKEAAARLLADLDTGLDTALDTGAEKRP
jgi:ribonuclease-3